MRFFDTVLLLLAANIATSIAKPLHYAPLDEIERRWSQGESEVCLNHNPGCYFLAWIRSLSSRSSIHAEHSHRDYTPAWPIVRDELAELSYDQRTMETRNHKRGGGTESSSPAKMKAFVQDFFRRGAQRGVLGRRKPSEAAPVLKPVKTVRYSFTA